MESVENATNHFEWLRAFAAQHGRPLRVLHVGNIANNAYLNAKFLRSVGVDAHVVCYDYYHVMATPEWEELELLDPHGDDFFPQFSKRDLRDYRRPAWYVSGPLTACASEIASLWGWRPTRVRAAVEKLSTRIIALTTKWIGGRAGYGLQLLITDRQLLLYKLRLFLSAKARKKPMLNRLFAQLRPIGAAPTTVEFRARARDLDNVSRLIAEYDEVFPQRPDRLTVGDIAPYQAFSREFIEMFRHYDIVQCYATEPIRALLNGKRPYVAFEHGTLRQFTMANDPQHRLTALAYRMADHCFITNGDCLAYAKQLDIENYSPMIHPVDVEQHRRSYGNAIDELRNSIGADVVLFCPARHDWDIKGTDQFIRALPLIKNRLSKRVKMVLIEWGRQVEDAKKLIRELGCTEDVIWKSSMCRIATIQHMQVADVVLDQMILPVFGAIAPQAIAAGRPVIASYVPEQTLWLIPEPAPILSAFCPEDIVDAVILALDPDWLADYEMRARHWIDTYHHPDVVVAEHLRVYRSILGDARAVDRMQVPAPSSIAGDPRGKTVRVHE